MKGVPRTEKPPADRHGRSQQLKEGLRYVNEFRPIRSLMLLLSAICLVGMPFQVLMPVFADDILERRAAHARPSDDRDRAAAP